MPALDVTVADDEAALAELRDLFREYAASLDFDLSFQGFEDELARLPGDYGPPHGRLLLARAGGAAAGCVAVRPAGPGDAELKRLYVRPSHRGTGAGRALAQAAIEAARGLGYRRLLLDTVPGMEAAQALYRSLGFEPIPPYRPNPVPGAAFLALRL
jgi:GNAT superfamily N-acetyltransferase